MSEVTELLWKVGVAHVVADAQAKALLKAGGPGGVAVTPDGRVWALEKVGRVDKPSPLDTYWEVEGDEIEHPTSYVEGVQEREGLVEPDDPGWYDSCYRLAGPEGSE